MLFSVYLIGCVCLGARVGYHLIFKRGSDSLILELNMMDYERELGDAIV